MTAFKVAAVQAAPAFLDLHRGVARTIELIGQAAAADARLVAFPECWLPGYPWWIWLDSTAANLGYIVPYAANALVDGSAELARICAAARAAGVFVSLGAAERDHGSLYIAQFLIGPDGQVLQKRRKLKPTHMERTVFGEGDGGGIRCIDTALGRIGQLNCWEHLQPLVKYAMYADHEQIHVAAWPSFSCYPAAYALGPEVNTGASRQYAVEGQCLVIAPCGVVSPAMLDRLVHNETQAALLLAGGGHARIFGPDGRALAEPLDPAAEGLLIAEFDPASIALAKAFADPVGHYARPDVLRLWFNPHVQPVLTVADAPAAPGLAGELQECA
jgi:nitrilase